MHSVENTKTYAHTFLTKISWKQRFYKPKSWFDETFFHREWISRFSTPCTVRPFSIRRQIYVVFLLNNTHPLNPGTPYAETGGPPEAPESGGHMPPPPACPADIWGASSIQVRLLIDW